MISLVEAGAGRSGWVGALVVVALVASPAIFDFVLIVCCEMEKVSGLDRIAVCVDVWWGATSVPNFEESAFTI